MEDDMDSDTARKIDDLLRQIDDIQKRVARLEQKEVLYGGPVKHSMGHSNQANGQFCLCGREVCRAPACPTFQPDPLGR
jgi:hypothetical protein